MEPLPLKTGSGWGCRAGAVHHGLGPVRRREQQGETLVTYKSGQLTTPNQATLKSDILIRVLGVFGTDISFLQNNNSLILLVD